MDNEMVPDNNRLEFCARQIEIGAKTTIEGILHVGRFLLEARKEFGENDKAFGQWRKKRLSWLDRAATLRFMQTAERFGGDLLQHFDAVEITPSVLYALAAPSTPDEVVESAAIKAESGEKVTIKDIAEWKQRAEEWRQQNLVTKRKQDAAEAEVLRIKKELESLQNREPEVIKKEIIKEIIPEGFASAEAAIAAKRKELEDQKREIKRLQEETLNLQGELSRLRGEEQDRQNRNTELARKKSRLLGFRQRLVGLLKETADHQLALSSSLMDNEIAEELEAIENHLLHLVDEIRKVRAGSAECDAGVISAVSYYPEVAHSR